MVILNVPLKKDSEFAVKLFEEISNALTDLKFEHGKWPDRLAFTGNIGVELHSYVIGMGWDLSKFGLSKDLKGPNKITIQYTKPLDQIQEPLTTQFDEAFHNRKINSIPGEATVQKILGVYRQPSFKIERSVRPSLEIRLIRQNK